MGDNSCQVPVEYRKENGDQVDKMIEFLCTVGRLKTIDRTGWILPGRSIPKPESIAGHMYRMGIIAMLFDDGAENDAIKAENFTCNGGCSAENEVKSVPNKCKLDVSKLVKMSLVHDMAECIVGDITPFDGISEQEKHNREMNAMNHLATLLPENIANNFLTLYHEYEDRETNESIIVKELDRFDVMLQAFQYEQSEYERAKRIVCFEEFFTFANQHIHHPKLRPMVLRIIEDRKRFFSKIQPK